MGRVGIGLHPFSPIETPGNDLFLFLHRYGKLGCIIERKELPSNRVGTPNFKCFR